jgi:hypothetical protein
VAQPLKWFPSRMVQLNRTLRIRLLFLGTLLFVGARWVHAQEACEVAKVFPQDLKPGSVLEVLESVSVNAGAEAVTFKGFELLPVRPDARVSLSASPRVPAPVCGFVFQSPLIEQWTLPAGARLIVTYAGFQAQSRILETRAQERVQGERSFQERTEERGEYAVTFRNLPGVELRCVAASLRDDIVSEKDLGRVWEGCPYLTLEDLRHLIGPRMAIHPQE